MILTMIPLTWSVNSSLTFNIGLYQTENSFNIHHLYVKIIGEKQRNLSITFHIKSSVLKRTPQAKIQVCKCAKKWTILISERELVYAHNFGKLYTILKLTLTSKSTKCSSYTVLCSKKEHSFHFCDSLIYETSQWHGTFRPSVLYDNWTSQDIKYFAKSWWKCQLKWVGYETCSWA